MHDSETRSAAFDWLASQVEIHGDVLPWGLLQRGFQFRDARVSLLSMQGIFTPRMMELPLSHGIHQPRNTDLRPDPERLANRYARFLEAARVA